MSRYRTPIHELVAGRLKELGIRRIELARRCGFANVNKGLRRIDAMCTGDLNSQCARMILEKLPMALEMAHDVIAVAVADTLDQCKGRAVAQQKAARCESFKPHAYLCGTETKPSSITVYGFSGGPERWLRIPIDCSRPPITYATQALAVVRNTPAVHFFGPTTGFIVNYSPNRAVRFDLGGNPVEVLSSAYSPGQVELQIGRHKMSGNSFGQTSGSPQRTLSSSPPPGGK